MDLYFHTSTIYHQHGFSPNTVIRRRMVKSKSQNVNENLHIIRSCFVDDSAFTIHSIGG